MSFAPRSSWSAWLCLLVLGCNSPSSSPSAPQTVAVDEALEPQARQPAAPQPQPEPDEPMRFMIVESEKRPVVRTPDSCVSLELDRESHDLRYRRGESPSCASFEASQDLLHEMLLALAASGDLAGVTSFTIGRDYAKLYERLALAASRSPAWDAKLGKARGMHSNAFVVATAKDASTFFPELVAMLRGTGMRAELRSVEKVLAGIPESTPFAATLLAAGVSPKAKLPYDCIVSFHLEPEGTSPPSPPGRGPG